MDSNIFVYTLFHDTKFEAILPENKQTELGAEDLQVPLLGRAWSTDAHPSSLPFPSLGPSASGDEGKCEQRGIGLLEECVSFRPQ